MKFFVFKMKNVQNVKEFFLSKTFQNDFKILILINSFFSLNTSLIYIFHIN